MATEDVGAETSALVEDGTNRFTLTLGSNWGLEASSASPTPSARSATEGEVIVLGRWSRADGGATTTVVRVNFGNRGAWRGDREFFANVEKGVVIATPGIRSLSRSRGKLGIVPHLDLRFVRDSKQTPRASIRFLFFRRYTLIATVAGTRGSRREADRILKSFKPYFP